MNKLLAALLLCSAVAAQAQKSTEVKLERVNDRRTNGSFSQLTITLELPKIRSSEVAASRVLVRTATDDSERDLVDRDAGEPSLEQNYRSSMIKEEDDSPMNVSLTLKNPARSVSKVTEVSGEIELYMPSKDPNSTAEVAKFLSSPGKPLPHKALKANGVELTLLGPTQIAAEKKRRIDAKRKELQEGGYEGESLESYLTDFASSVLSIEETELLFRIKDPKKAIQSIVYVDSKGEEQRVSTGEEEGLTLFSNWSGKPEADWKLRVSMKTPKNLVRYPFRLADVPLP